MTSLEKKCKNKLLELLLSLSQVEHWILCLQIPLFTTLPQHKHWENVRTKYGSKISGLRDVIHNNHLIRETDHHKRVSVGGGFLPRCKWEMRIFKHEPYSKFSYEWLVFVHGNIYKSVFYFHFTVMNRIINTLWYIWQICTYDTYGKYIQWHISSRISVSLDNIILS